MTGMTGSRIAWLRWLLPAAAVLAVTAGAAAVKGFGAASDPQLPARTAAQLLTDLQTARLEGLSGTVTQRADLGLPALPGLGGQGSSDLASLVSGTHTLKVWYSGPSSARVALLGTLGESDIITNGRDVWIWSSRDNSAVHRTLPARETPAAPLNPAMLPTSPQEAAAAVLAAIDPTTVVTTSGSARVAGRAAYELSLAPRDSDSLISQVKVAIDAAEQVPLRVQVFAANTSEAAIEVAFTQVTFARPGAEHFKFNPPPGAKITEQKAEPQGESRDQATPNAPAFTVVGRGWTAVLAARTGAAAGSGSAGDAGLTGMLKQLPAAQGSWGSGRLLASRLFSVLITDDGRILVGAVTPQRLQKAAADPAAALKPAGA
jgi:outer membrane lipoprotein-sorting protein